MELVSIITSRFGESFSVFFSLEGQNRKVSISKEEEDMKKQWKKLTCLLASVVFFISVSLSPDIVLGAEFEEKAIKDICLNIGSDETEKNITWLGTSRQPTMVQVLEGSADVVEGSAFTSSCVDTFMAVQDTATITGYKTNKATITKLKANTKYFYRVGNEEQWSKTYSFKTNSFGINQPFHFFFIGDTQIGASGNLANDVTNWNHTITKAIDAFPDTSFILSSGDQVNDRSSSEDLQYEGFLFPSAMRAFAIATNVGNHDVGSEKYTDHFYMPNISTYGVSNGTGEGSGDYWFTYNGVLFLCLNTSNLSTNVHKVFMEEALEKNPDVNWRVVSFHHSTYSVGNHFKDTDVLQRRKELSPIFSLLGIDVVLMGHDHYFTRTYLMEGCNPIIPEGYDTTKGEAAPISVINPKEGQVLYLTANSASGSKYYARNSNLSTGWPSYVAVQDQSNRTSITKVTVTEDTLCLDTYYTDKEELELMDTFTIRRIKEITIFQ